jgi:N-alpha-acetyl-L-2,4-diaminobutyrate deacetylase
MTASPIVPTVDLMADGVQHGFLRLPWSRDDSAWGNLMIPITVIRNGAGPTALLTGGSHGDEYEGPVALVELARTLDPAQVSGAVVIVPFLNYPAFRAGRRLSPVDGANMNRIFPGKADGTLTQKIADYVQRTLLPMADVVLDFHSGGKTLDFVPFAAAHALPDPEHEARCHAARDAFGAPYSMTMLEIDAVGMLDTAAEEMGKVFVTTELGGAGTATARSIAIAKRGVRNVLIHAGIVAGEIDRQPSIRLDMPSGDCFTFADTDGLIEPCVDLGDPVTTGDLIARIHSAVRTGAAPVEYRARLTGILAARHAPGLVAIGDCVGVVATLV